MFTDEDFYAATARVLTRSGYPSLTLEAVAQEAGCARPALNRRFGGKQGLVEAFVIWITNQIDRKFEILTVGTTSPLAILKAGSFAFSTGNQASNNASFDPSNQLKFFANAWLDQNLRPLMVELAHEYERSAARILRQALDAGELLPCDVDEIAHLLSIALTGAIMHGGDGSNETLLAAQERAFDAVLRPYIRTP